MSHLWISKQGLVTLVASISLHAAAVVFMRAQEDRAAVVSATPTLLPVEVDEQVATEAPPEPPAESQPAIETRPVTRVRVTANRAMPVVGREEPSGPDPRTTAAPETAALAPPRFIMSAAVTAGAPNATASTSSMSNVGTTTDGAGAVPVDERQVSVPARLLSRAPVQYPPEARAQEIETDVRVEIVVDATGRVVAARSLSNAGYHLDEAAERAIRQYRFSPALREGRAVSVRMRWTVQFRLQ